MISAAISGTGLFTPPHAISNDELVASYNRYADMFNAENAEAIAAGEIAALDHSSTEFIIKASGIKSRYVMNKEGVLDPARMAPNLPERPNDQLSILAEMAVAAAKQALAQAGREAQDVDGVLVACSNLQRPYPAIAVEVQDALGIGDGFGFDMNVACSSATFGIQAAADMIRAGSAKRILVLNPEICSGHLNFRNRDCHFIFGDVATALLIERRDEAGSAAFEIVGTKLKTKFSNNIRNNFGFLNNAAPEGIGKPDKLFVQEGRKVFKEVIPMVSDIITAHLEQAGIGADRLRRMWLHQANQHMNELISRKVLGRDPSEAEAPIILDQYANTSSAGSIIAFHKYREDLKSGDTGIICSFGAGYSVGSVIVRKT
jgi:beta-ketodecanoyl-[acyl-carrier-protein] synthase